MACTKFFDFGNGSKMPALGIGTWQAPDAEIETALDLALEAGYRHIDTAPVYMNEKAIGRVLTKWLGSGKIKREELFIVTKLPPQGNRASTVEKYLRTSLEDLKLSYVDLYLIHTPFTVPELVGNDFVRDENGHIKPDTTSDHIDTWKKMEEMVQLGLTKNIGVSNFNKRQLKRILDNSTIKPVSLQIELHVYLQQKELVDFCKENSVVVTAYAPLGSKGIASINKQAGVDRQLPDLMDNSEVVRIAQKHKKTPAQVLIRWILQRDVATIPKSTNPVRLRQNLDVFDFTLSQDDMEALSKLDSNVRVCDFAFFKGVEQHPEFPW